jgi:hypothetical protein
MYKYLGSIQQLYDCLIKPNFWKSKTFIITLPSKEFIINLYRLREFQFSIVYDIMDEWEEFHKLGQAIWYESGLEEQLIINSDAVFAVSTPLIEKFRHLREDIHLNGNGYNEEMLGKTNKLIANASSESKATIKVGYFGHLTESWFDWSLVFDLARRNEKIIFEIIGYGCSDDIFNEIKKYSNIRYLGQKKHEELVNFAKHWSVGLIPFKNTVLSEAVDPIKIYEYLYFGLTVLSSGIPHLRSYPNTWAAENATDADKLLKEIIDKKRNYCSENELNEFLFKSQWNERFNELFLKVERSSIISNLTKL